MSISCRRPNDLWIGPLWKNNPLGVGNQFFRKGKKEGS
jgi:hypothetical protein